MVGNWGVAIILLTVIIKLIFYPLSAASYQSMAKMRVMAPKLQKLKEQYGDDRQRMQQAMMEMYKTEKINPLGGCLPIVVQIPVFIALYWVLLASVELRHAPFICGSTICRARIPYATCLPVLMGATMIIQTLPESRAAGPGAGEGHEDHADRVQRVLLLLPRGPGAVLAGQQRALDRAAVADHAHDRADKARSCKTLTRLPRSPRRRAAPASASCGFPGPAVAAISRGGHRQRD